MNLDRGRWDCDVLLERRPRWSCLHEILTAGNLEIRVASRNNAPFLHGRADVIIRPDGAMSSFINSINEIVDGWEHSCVMVWEDRSEIARSSAILRAYLSASLILRLRVAVLLAGMYGSLVGCGFCMVVPYFLAHCNYWMIFGAFWSHLEIPIDLRYFISVLSYGP